MKNTFTATVLNTITKEVTVHNNCTSVVSNLSGVLISTKDLEQYQYDSNHIVGIVNIQ